MTLTTFEIEKLRTPPFFNKMPLSIERGQGVYVWDEDGRRYTDFTSGWGVTCLGHAHPVVTDAICRQAQKIIQNPNSGLTCSPVRAQLLQKLAEVMPPHLTRVFFSNSGAEANDAAIKLARKVTGRLDVVAAHQSFHGRTISTASATGQAKHREKFNPLMPNYRFVPFGDMDAMERALDAGVAAVLLEPIQGEGGVRVPPVGYLQEVSRMCKTNGSLLIVDEIQTGFCRTGPLFAIEPLDIEADFMTMAKGIAGGFPLGAFAMSEAVAARIEIGDHGGTYCGNPLGCAVALAVLNHLIDHQIDRHVERMGRMVLARMRQWQQRFGDRISDVRGKGLLTAFEMPDEAAATHVHQASLAEGLLLNVIQGNIVRVFPALNVTETELEEGLQVIENALIGV